MKKLFNAKKVILAAIALVILLETVDQSFASAYGASCGCLPDPPGPDTDTPASSGDR
jgi:hypothetical protein